MPLLAGSLSISLSDWVQNWQSVIGLNPEYLKMLHKTKPTREEIKNKWLWLFFWRAVPQFHSLLVQKKKCPVYVVLKECKFIIYSEVQFDSLSSKLDILLPYMAITLNSECQITATSNCTYIWVLLLLSLLLLLLLLVVVVVVVVA